MEDLLLLEVVERFCKGELNAEDMQHFENLRQSNSEIDQLVVEHIFFLKQLDNYADQKQLRTELDNIHTQLQHNKEISLTKEAKVVGFFGKYRKKLAVAATIAALFTISTMGILFAYHKGKNDNNDEYKKLNYHVQGLEGKVNNIVSNIAQGEKKATTSAIVPSVSGTGFVINQRGYLLTNYHVIDGSRKLYVFNEKFGDLEAEVVKTDIENDLAVLKITDTSFLMDKKIPFSFIDHDLDLGQRIYTLGFPRNNSLAYIEGYISSKAANTALQNKEKFLLTLQVDEGHSGSPIINNNGEIIGIIAAQEKLENGFAVGVKPSSIRNLINALNSSLDKTIVLPSKSNMSKYSRNEQIRKISDYIFMVKVK